MNDLNYNKIVLILIIFCSYFLSCGEYKAELDTVWNLMNSGKVDEAKTLLLELNNEELSFKEIEQKYSYLGYVYQVQRKHELAIGAYRFSIENETPDSRFITININNLIKAYIDNLRYDSVPILYSKLKEMNRDDSLQSLTLINMAHFYFARGLTKKGISYVDSAIQKAIKYNDKKALASIYQNTAVKLEEYEFGELANQYLLKSLDIYKEINDTVEIVERYLDLMSNNIENKDSILIFEKDLMNFIPLDSISSFSGYYLFKINFFTSHFLADSLLKYLKIYDSLRIQNSNTLDFNLDYHWFKYYERVNNELAIKKAKSIVSYRSDIFIENNIELLKFLKNNSKNKNEELKYSNLYISELENHISTNSELQLANFNYKSKVIELEKQNAENDRKAAQNELEMEEEKSQRILLYTGIMIILVILMFVIRLARIQKQNTKIQIEKNIEIEKQKEEIQKKKEESEELYEELMSSLRYGRNIQEKILTSNKVFDSLLSEYFLIYKPKDQVSGDYYWIGEHNGNVFIALADCTGHGAPAAMMTMLGIQFLDDAIIKEGFYKPNQILDYLDYAFDILFGGDETTNAGMEIAIIKINKEEELIEYSSAKRNILELQNGEIITHKSTLREIGSKRKNASFQNVQIPYNRNSRYYIFSDGLVHLQQPDSKKWGIKNVKQFILRNQELNNIDLHLEFETVIEDFNSKHPQRDDIALLSFKI